MNKLLTSFCASIAAGGLLILTRSTYYTIVYGDGNLEAGNFHRYVFSVERDLETGNTRRRYELRRERLASTERLSLAEDLDMWLVGIGLIALGAGIYVVEWSSQGRHHQP